MSLRRALYRAASRLGDLEAVSSGDPSRIAKRVVRKGTYRRVGRTMRKWGL